MRQIIPPPYNTDSAAVLFTLFHMIPARNTTDNGGARIETKPWLNSKKPLPEFAYKYAIPTDKTAASSVSHLPVFLLEFASIGRNFATTSKVRIVLKELSPDETVSINAAIKAAIHKPCKPAGINCCTSVIYAFPG